MRTPETLVEALERVDVGCGHDCRVAIADHAASLLPLLVAHATPGARAALLRTLLDASEAGGLMTDFRDRMNSEYPPNTLIADGGWHAKVIWRWLRYRLIGGPLSSAPSPAPLEGTNDD